jgi:hypothetical protein
LGLAAGPNRLPKLPRVPGANQLQRLEQKLERLGEGPPKAEGSLGGPRLRHLVEQHPGLAKQLGQQAHPGTELGEPATHPGSNFLNIHVVIHPHASTLNWWQYGLTVVVGILLAGVLIRGSVWLLEIGRRRRDARIAACFLGIRRALASGDGAALSGFSTEQFAAWLVRDASSGGGSPRGKPGINWVTVLKGGRRRDRECLARIEAIGEFVDVGATEIETTAAAWSNDAVWRFVRGSDRRWIAAGIDTDFFFEPSDAGLRASAQTDGRPEATPNRRKRRALGAERLTEQRKHPTARAAISLVRPDVLRAEMNNLTIAGRAPGVLVPMTLCEPLRRPVEGATANLPERLILRLDEDGSLHLFPLVMGMLHSKVGKEVAHWPAGSARVSLCSAHGFVRPVEIAYRGGHVLLGATRRTRRQRAGLRTIEAATAEETAARSRSALAQQPA